MAEKKRGPGQPRKYTPEQLLVKWDDYLAECSKKEKLPTIMGYTLFLGISRECLYNYFREEEGIKYSATKEKIESELEEITVQAAAQARNPAFLIFYLKNKFKYADKLDQTLSDPDGKGLQINFNIPRPEK